MVGAMKMANRMKDQTFLSEEDFIKAVSFNGDGLVPAIAQDAVTGEVLMMAWMTKDTLQETIKTKRACYWSRSRQSFWRKGDSSGHEQHIIGIDLDCDGDTILLKIEQIGAACHTGARSCFFTSLDKDA